MVKLKTGQDEKNIVKEQVCCKQRIKNYITINKKLNKNVMIDSIKAIMTIKNSFNYI